MELETRALLSRRNFCLCCLSGAAIAATNGWLSPRQAYAEARGLVSLIKDSAATSPITTHKLRGNISVLEGSGGNIAVLTGPDGKVLVDAGIRVSRPQLTKAMADTRRRSGHPSRQHPLAFRPCRWQRMAPFGWRQDHRAGEHAQVPFRRSAGRGLGLQFPSAATGRLPSEVFSSERSLKLNGTSIALKYYGPAHTDSDISVTFAEANVVHVGDTFWNGIYPFIDYSTGGSIDGMIAASEANLAATTDRYDHHLRSRQAGRQQSRTPGVSRHAGADPRQRRPLKKQGRTRDETVAAKPTAAFDAIWGNFVIDPGFFTRLVYQGV